jgi:DnaK suppressor protein
MAVKKPAAKPTKAKKTATAKVVSKPETKAAAKAPSKPVAAPKAAAHASRAAAPLAPNGKPSSRPAVRPAPPVIDVSVARQPETDGDDGETRTSLLSGPRNVQPYVTRKGEEYMSKEQLEHFRFILSSWKQDLMQEVDRTMLHMKDEAANFPDPNDRATQESEFSLELRTRDRERKLIRKIDEAIKRVEDGSYGYCLETGEEIGVKRLEARPVATLTIEAQERRERRERQYGDRDDRYR